MPVRRSISRGLTALFAVLQLLAPGAAAIADARPAATALRAGVVVHVEAPGSDQHVAHLDRCALCSLATQVLAAPPSTGAIAVPVAAAWPPRDSWRARYRDARLSSGHSRAPPV
ncbi:MAG: hypothetical protein ABIZ91_16785 [Gemmatimonadaceae bacterium]